MDDRSDRVRVASRPGHLEVRFDGRFSFHDVEAVRSIPGRRWLPDRLIWTLPRTESALARLRRAFGPRLTLVPDDDVPGRPDSRSTPGASTPSGLDQQVTERIIAEIRRICRTREYSPRTERAYIDWTRRFLAFHANRSRGGYPHTDAPPQPGSGPGQLPVTPPTAADAAAFLEHLATRRGLAAKSRNQAASALAFMFKEVLGRDEMADVPRARGPKRMPVVLSHREVLQLLRQLTGKHFLIAVILYSAGLRLEECLHLRVKDVDFDLRQIVVRDGKGRKDRYVPLARRAIDLLRAQITHVAERHEDDVAAGHGWAPLPGAMHRKDPGAGHTLAWQFLFPASRVTADPVTGHTGRAPLHATAAQRAIKDAVRRAGITKRATCHTLRHSFATEALRGGCDIRTLQHVMGHRDVRTTMIYLHVVEQTGLYVRSPLDRPDDPEDLNDDLADDGPFASMARQWELAGRQWSAARPRRPPHGD